MAKFQLLSCYVHLGGERGNVVFRGKSMPVTYPETLLLQAIHGGQEHVHSLIAIGEVERTHEEEFMRLQERYGAIVKTAFPTLAGRVSLPEKDDSVPTQEEVDEVKSVSDAAMKSVKAKRGRPKATEKKKPADVPSLEELPQ